MRALTRRRDAGFTLAELVMVAALLAMLAGMAMPVAKFTVKRRKEMELRLALRQMRTAIDEYKRLSDQGIVPIKVGGQNVYDVYSLAEGIALDGTEYKDW